MRILIYGLNYTPELTGIGKYSGEMAEWLSAQGHDVRVITAPMYYPAWRIGDGFSAWRYCRELRAGVDVIRCPLYVPEKPTGLLRVIHLLSFAASSCPVVLGQAIMWQPDVVFTVSPTFFCAPAAWLAACLSRATAWLHLQDLEVDAAFDLGLLPKKFHRIAAFLERTILRRFFRVSTISESMSKRLISKGVNERNAVLFPNWVDTDDIRPSNASLALCKELNIPNDKIRILYSGNMGEKQNLGIVIEAARELAGNNQLHFVLCGDGSARKMLELQASALTNVSFLPLQPAERLNAFMNLADIHLIIQRHDAADLVMPSKLATILACGGAVIATATPGTELAKVVKQAAGVICAPGNATDLASCIGALAADSQRRREMGIHARNWAVAHLNKSLILSQLERALQLAKQSWPQICNPSVRQQQE